MLSPYMRVDSIIISFLLLIYFVSRSAQPAAEHRVQAGQRAGLHQDQGGPGLEQVPRVLLCRSPTRHRDTQLFPQYWHQNPGDLRWVTVKIYTTQIIISYFGEKKCKFLSFFLRAGMSECSGPQLTNTMEAQQIGAIGKSFPGFHTLLKPVKDSEIIEEKGGGTYKYLLSRLPVLIFFT